MHEIFAPPRTSPYISQLQGVVSREERTSLGPSTVQCVVEPGAISGELPYWKPSRKIGSPKFERVLPKGPHGHLLAENVAIDLEAVELRAFPPLVSR
jgi:hypothetical protein